MAGGIGAQMTVLRQQYPADQVVIRTDEVRQVTPVQFFRCLSMRGDNVQHHAGVGAEVSIHAPA